MGCRYEVIRETRVRGSVLTQLREMADQGALQTEAGAPSAAGPATSEPAGRGFAVRIDTFEGPDRREQAVATIRRLKRDAGLADLWVVDRGESLELYHGRFARRDEPLAEVALAQVRGATVDGEQPFADATLVPLVAGAEPGVASTGAAEHNLRRFSDHGLLTLQVAVYDEAFGPGFRDAAEQAVASLRGDGEEAYFYHGPFRSMVTLGLFNFDDDFVQQGNVRAYGPAIRALRERFPYNLVNGVTVIEKNARGEVKGEQESLVVRVP